MKRKNNKQNYKIKIKRIYMNFYYVNNVLDLEQLNN